MRKIPWRRNWLPNPVFLPRKSPAQTSLVNYSPWAHKRVRHDLETKQQHQMWNQYRLSSSTKWDHEGDNLDLFFTAGNAYAYGTCWAWNLHYSYTLYLELWNDKTFWRGRGEEQLVTVYQALKYIHSILVCWGWCYLKNQQLGGLNNRNVLSHSSEGWKPKIRVSVRLIPSGAMRKNLFHDSLLPFCWFAGNLWHSWLAEAASQCLTWSLYGILLWDSLCVQMSLFNKDTSHVGSDPHW